MTAEKQSDPWWRHLLSVEPSAVKHTSHFFCLSELPRCFSILHTRIQGVASSGCMSMIFWEEHLTVRSAEGANAKYLVLDDAHIGTCIPHQQLCRFDEPMHGSDVQGRITELQSQGQGDRA